MKQRNHHNQTQEIIGCRPLCKQQSHSTVSSLLHLNQNTREQHRTYTITTKITNRRTTWSQNLTHTSRTESAKLERTHREGIQTKTKSRWVEVNNLVERVRENLQHRTGSWQGMLQAGSNNPYFITTRPLSWQVQLQV